MNHLFFSFAYMLLRVIQYELTRLKIGKITQIRFIF